jgi:hypothetical protein
VESGNHFKNGAVPKNLMSKSSGEISMRGLKPTYDFFVIQGVSHPNFALEEAALGSDWRTVQKYTKQEKQEFRGNRPTIIHDK